MKTTQLDDGDRAFAAMPEICWRRGFAETRDAWRDSSGAPAAAWFGVFLVAAATVLARRAVLLPDPDQDVDDEDLAGAGDHAIVNTCTVGAGDDDNRLLRLAANAMIVETDPAVRIFDRLPIVPDVVGALERHDAVVVHAGELTELLERTASGLYARLGRDRRRVRQGGKTRVDLLDPFLCMTASSTAAALRAYRNDEWLRPELRERFNYFAGRSTDRMVRTPPDPRPADALRELLRGLRRRHRHGQRYALAFKAAAVLVDRTERGTWWRILARRLALIYGAVEGTTLIGRTQVKAAVAFVDWQRELQAALLPARFPEPESHAGESAETPLATATSPSL